MSAGASAEVQPGTGAVEQAALGPLQAAAYAALSGLSRAAAQTQSPASEYSPAAVRSHVLSLSETTPKPHSQAAHDTQPGLSLLRQPASSPALPLSQPQPPQPQAGHSELIQATAQAVQSQPTSDPGQTLEHPQAEALPASSLPHAVANSAAPATQDTVSAAAPIAVSPVKSGFSPEKSGFSPEKSASSPDGRLELLCDQLAAVLARIPATSDCQLVFSSPPLQDMQHANDDTGGLFVITICNTCCLTMHVRAV